MKVIGYSLIDLDSVSAETGTFDLLLFGRFLASFKCSFSILSKVHKGCCERCKADLEILQDEVKDLRRQIKKLRKKQGAVGADVEAADPASTLEEECRELTANSTSLFGTVNLLLRKLFSADEIISHSVSGKAANSNILAKPKFDDFKLNMIRKIAADIHGLETANHTAITVKIQAVQKAVRRESKQ